MVMNLEAQCLAMAKDRGEIYPGQILEITSFTENPVSKITEKYTTREAVVEAIKEAAKDNDDYQYKFSDFLGKIHASKKGYKITKAAIADVSELREAHIKARGLWAEEIKEETKWVRIDQIQGIATKAAKEFLEAMKESGELKVVNIVEKPKEEEVVLPTKKQCREKLYKSYSHLEWFIANYEPDTEAGSYLFRQRLKSLIAEVRRKS